MVYEPRNIRNKEKTSANDFLSDIKEKTLFEALIDYDKIVLLGNPGVGFPFLVQVKSIQYSITFYS